MPPPLPLADEGVEFSYHRAVAPMMWMFVALASVELLVVHLLVLLLWNGVAATLLSLVTLAGIGWLIFAIASMRRRPVVVGPTALTMRVGALKSVTVPLAEVAGCAGEAAAGGPAAGGSALGTTLNLALIAHPNVLVVLRQPLPGRRRIDRLAHRLDDPHAFVTSPGRALARAQAAR